jgi:hypothetical protein
MLCNQVTRIFGGISIGARLGIYLFGVLVPWFNSKVNKTFHII